MCCQEIYPWSMKQSNNRKRYIKCLNWEIGKKRGSIKADDENH